MKQKFKKWWPLQLSAVVLAILLPAFVYSGYASYVSEGTIWFSVAALIFIALAPLKWG